jgi:hypothetical protein
LNGSCTHTNNTSACNDHDRCTQTDTCQSGACVGSNLVVCNDGNVCTTDTCLSGLCTYTNNTNACDDGNPCTTGDVCGPLFAEDFDSVTRPALPTGWTSTVTSGISWMTQSNGVDNAEVFGFAEYWQTLQDNVLDSPPIAIASPTSTLTFRNRWSFDHVFDLFCLDASVLEIKIGAGSFTDIVTAGGSFVSGEYTGSVFGGSNPLLGRQAWCFSSTGYPAYLTTKVNLPAAVAGQTIQLRWRIGMDSGTFSGGVGQGIDSIVLGGTCGGTVTVCNDNNPCTDDSCNPASGCVHGNNTNSCDDGNACTAGDTCRAGNCLAPVVLTQPLGSPIAVGTNPISMAVGDVSGDGKLDLAVANQSSHNVTILLGDGSGGFSPASGSPLPVGTNPVSVAAGDVNGDLKLDLVVVNASSGDATILLGNGSGGFSPAAGSPVAVGASPRAVVARDWNGDGKLDLAVANRFSDFVTILLGDGSGGFSVAAGSPVAVGTSPYSIAVGDANADGKLDLMAANNGSNNVTILLGSGSGGFSQAGGSPVAVGANPESVAAGDLNGDGKLDLATANAGSNNVTVLLGNGSGGFTAAAQSPLSVGANPEFVAASDMNGDGKLDLIVANGSANNVTILLGNGSGGFSEAGGSPVAVGTNPVPVAIGNWNADGKLDLAVANFSSSNVTIFLNSTTSAPDGTTCNDGSACTTGDACNNGSCLGTAGSAPGEVGTVSASKSGTTATFSWVMTAGASAHDMLRGRVRDWPVGSNPATETCFDDVPGLLTASDATVPAVADGYWYLVRAENVCGNGGYGSQASHSVPTVPRSSATCP